MRKNKNFLLYIFSITFCCLTLLVFNSNKVNASDVYTCIDKDKENGECDASSINFYYRLDEYNVESDITTLTIPSEYSSNIDGVELEANVEELKAEFIKTDNSLELNELVLPSNLVKLSSGSLKNISTLTDLIIPSSVTVIEEKIFDDNAEVENIYLTKYIFDLTTYIDVNKDAFTNAKLSNLICADKDMYSYFLDKDSTLKNAPLALKVTYTFYKYESKSLSSLDDRYAIYHYYIGKYIDYNDNNTLKNRTINELPDPINAEGLEFKGWYYQGENLLNVDGDIHYTTTDADLDFEIYPKYELEELTFEIKNSDGSAVSNDYRYDGGSVLTTLTATNFNHTLYTNGQNINFSIDSIEWEKDETALNTTQVAIKEYLQSGEYKAIVTYSYLYKNITYIGNSEAKIRIRVAKASLYVTIEDITKIYGTYIEKEDYEYTITGLLRDDKDTDLNIWYEYPSSGNIEVGLYLNQVRFSILSTNIINNYNIMYSYGDYIVKTKTIEAYYENNLELEYGEEINIVKEVNDTIYNNYQLSFNVYFNKEIGLDVGTYAINGVKSVSNTNYRIDFNLSKTTGKVIINAKEVEASVEIDNRTYNAREKEIKAYYYDINNVKVDVDYKIKIDSNIVNKMLEAGTYTIEFESLDNDNYHLTNENEIVVIHKALPNVTYQTYQRFTYSGVKYNPIITIDNEEQEPVFTCMVGNMVGDYCKDAGTYSVMITYDESENYREYSISTPITLVVERMIVSLNPRKFSFYYGEKIEASEKIIINGEEVEVKYDTLANKNSEIGNYNIVNATIYKLNGGGLHLNYSVTMNTSDCENKIQIVKRPVEIVFYNYENLIYNGKEQFIGAYLVDTISDSVVDSINVSVVADEGIVKDAKTYHLRAYFESDYYYASNTNLLVLTVGKAKYDLSNIKFNSQEFILNFKKHYLYIEGELPEGVSVRYEIDGEEKNSLSFGGKKVVTAVLVGDSLNYEDIEVMKATIKIDMGWFYITIVSSLLVILVCIGAILYYLEYRRNHPKKIKIKIKNMFKEDAEAKRVATSVKEVLGDEKVEVEEVENDDDIVENVATEKSFIEKIYSADSELKYYYSEVKNELLSYEGITHNVDRRYEVFYHGTRQVAKLSICNNVLKLYVNLDPSKYDRNQYNHRDMSKFDDHARTPLRIDVNTTESLRNAKVFIRIIRRKENLKSVSSFVRIDYEKFYTLKENVFPKLFKKVFTTKGKKNK